MKIKEHIKSLWRYYIYSAISRKLKSKPNNQIESKINLSSNDIIEYFHQLTEEEQEKVYFSISAIQETKRKQKYKKSFEYLIEQCKGFPEKIKHEHKDLIIQWSDIELVFKVPGNRLIFEHVCFNNLNYSFFEVDKDNREVLQNILQKYYFEDK